MKFSFEHRFVLAVAAAAAVLVPSVAQATTAPSITPKVGAMQVVLGPSGNIDSLYATVKNVGKTYAFMANGTEVMYDQAPTGRLYNPRPILRNGPKGSINQCGTHMAGSLLKVGNGHWVGFMHVETADPAYDRGNCSEAGHPRNPTRWSIIRVNTFDSGRTWTMGRRVITQDRAFLYNPDGSWATATDDAGSPRLVVHNGYLYLFYRAVSRAGHDQQAAIARATVASEGRPGSWHKWYDGSFSQPGLGGHQSPLTSLPSTARGITWNTYLHAFVTVHVWHATGISLFESAGPDFTSWTKIAQLTPSLGTVSPWNQPCGGAAYPAAQSYGATIGMDGSSSITGSHLWIYYMFKPKGECFHQRLLIRREVALTGRVWTYPNIHAPLPSPR